MDHITVTNRAIPISVDESSVTNNSRYKNTNAKIDNVDKEQRQKLEEFWRLHRNKEKEISPDLFPDIDAHHGTPGDVEEFVTLEVKGIVKQDEYKVTIEEPVLLFNPMQLTDKADVKKPIVASMTRQTETEERTKKQPMVGRSILGVNKKSPVMSFMQEKLKQPNGAELKPRAMPSMSQSAQVQTSRPTITASTASTQRLDPASLKDKTEGKEAARQGDNKKVSVSAGSQGASVSVSKAESDTTKSSFAPEKQLASELELKSRNMPSMSQSAQVQASRPTITASMTSTQRLDPASLKDKTEGKEAARQGDNKKVSVSAGSQGASVSVSKTESDTTISSFAPEKQLASEPELKPRAMPSMSQSAQVQTSRPTITTSMTSTQRLDPASLKDKTEGKEVARQGDNKKVSVSAGSQGASVSVSKAESDTTKSSFAPEKQLASEPELKPRAMPSMSQSAQVQTSRPTITTSMTSTQRLDPASLKDKTEGKEVARQGDNKKVSVSAGSQGASVSVSKAESDTTKSSFAPEKQLASEPELKPRAMPSMSQSAQVQTSRPTITTSMTSTQRLDPASLKDKTEGKEVARQGDNKKVSVSAGSQGASVSVSKAESDTTISSFAPEKQLANQTGLKSRTISSTSKPTEAQISHQPIVLSVQGFASTVLKNEVESNKDASLQAEAKGSNFFVQLGNSDSTSLRPANADDHSKTRQPTYHSTYTASQGESATKQGAQLTYPFTRWGKEHQVRLSFSSSQSLVLIPSSERVYHSVRNGGLSVKDHLIVIEPETFGEKPALITNYEQNDEDSQEQTL
ncbi:hypothetical protein [Proteus mirabilis]|uniref:SpaN/EivJ family type III secretion system needle length determinant n=1 Tax=Proteus mirabilis TaxID=584 RepID=UPI0023498879|nr:hypothetical protein [Proteus mirabilis]MDC5999375.1 hypothetical protein [Proteus mirabilis]MDC6069869.1 hypothetical protein [Proteus mirabilis]